MGRGSSGIGGGNSGGSESSSSNNPTYKGITAGTYNYQQGVYRLGEGATESQALDIVNNAPFSDNSYGGKSLGVSVRSEYSIERTDGSIEKVSNDQTYSTSYHQRSDGTWMSGRNDKIYKSEAAAERNARRELARDVSEEMAWGRTLSMKTGSWKRR